MERRLAAILSADVQGYGRLMSEDEVATVRTLTAYRELMGSLIRQHRGRVVDAPGDNLLAEFPSVIDAVQGAVAIQRDLRARNAELPESRRMRFRIGINLGDLIVDGERIYGDGVNIAARVEALAQAGGVCLSGPAYDQVDGKLPLLIEDLGEHAVKNIPKPVRVYRVQMERGRSGGTATAAESAVSTGIDAPIPFGTPVPLPDRPSIVVLPFENLSADPAQDYLSRGLTDTLITHLYKVPDLFVIAKTSSLYYKGKAVMVQQVSRELGVRYVLEGGVQKAGDRIRVNVQLSDALAGHHVWAERYDRELADVLAVQDEITLKVITELGVKLTWGEVLRSLIHSTKSLEAAVLYFEADAHLVRVDRESVIRSRELLEKAIELDPQYGRAIAYLGVTHLLDCWYGFSRTPDASLKLAEEYAERAGGFDDDFYLVHVLRSRILLHKGRWEAAIAAGARAVETEPGNTFALSGLATTLIYADRPAEALGLMRTAMRLSPYPPATHLALLGHAHALTGRHDVAIAAYRQYLERQATGAVARFVRQGLIASLMEAGREAEAGVEVERFLEQDPTVTIASLVAETRLRPYTSFTFLDRQADLLRRAGLPD